MSTNKQRDEKTEQAIVAIADYIDQTSGGLVTNALGLVADRVKYWRIKQALSLKEKTEKLLQERGVNEPRSVPAKFLLPLLDAATVEEDDDLHTRYATLLANARDPNFKSGTPKYYVSILSELEPFDMLLLDKIFDAAPLVSNNNYVVLNKLSEAVHVDQMLCKISVRNLMRLGLVRAAVIEYQSDGAITFNKQFPLTSYRDVQLFKATELGAAFIGAIRSKPSDVGVRSNVA